MGFYAPAQIVQDARAHGVEMRPICINASRGDCTLEPIGEDRFAVRLGMRMLRGLNEQDAARSIAPRAGGPIASTEEIGRAPWRDRVCPYGYISDVGGSAKKQGKE